MFLKDIVMGDESGYCTIMWNGRDCEAKQNEPPPTKQRPVCIQRWCRVYGGIGSSVQFSSSVMSDSVTPWTAACQVSYPSPLRRLLKLISIDSVMPSNNLILCHPLLLPSIFPSIRVFSNESVLCIRWPKYWSFSFNISSSNEYLGLISFRMDWLDLLAVQETLKSLLWHYSSKSSILWHSALFIVQLSFHTWLLEKS